MFVFFLQNLRDVLSVVSQIQRWECLLFSTILRARVEEGSTRYDFIGFLHNFGSTRLFNFVIQHSGKYLSASFPNSLYSLCMLILDTITICAVYYLRLFHFVDFENVHDFMFSTVVYSVISMRCSTIHVMYVVKFLLRQWLVYNTQDYVWEPQTDFKYMLSTSICYRLFC